MVRFETNYFTSKNNTTMKKASKVNMVPMGHVKPEPAWQGEPFKVNSRTEVRMPANCKLSRKEWEAKMIEKYMSYERRNELGRLTGAAKTKVKAQL
jgi:hypothetical protein